MGRRTADRGKALMSPDEVATATGIGVESIRAMMKSGMLKTTQIGKRSYVPRVDYQRWLKGEERVAESEVDEQEAARNRIVQIAYDAVMVVLTSPGIANTREERTILALDVAMRLMKGVEEYYQ